MLHLIDFWGLQKTENMQCVKHWIFRIKKAKKHVDNQIVMCYNNCTPKDGSFFYVHLLHKKTLYNRRF